MYASKDNVDIDKLEPFLWGSEAKSEKKSTQEKTLNAPGIEKLAGFLYFDSFYFLIFIHTIYIELAVIIYRIKMYILSILNKASATSFLKVSKQ